MEAAQQAWFWAIYIYTSKDATIKEEREREQEGEGERVLIDDGGDAPVARERLGNYSGHSRAIL